MLYEWRYQNWCPGKIPMWRVVFWLFNFPLQFPMNTVLNNYIVLLDLPFLPRGGCISVAGGVILVYQLFKALKHFRIQDNVEKLKIKISFGSFENPSLILILYHRLITSLREYHWHPIIWNTPDILIYNATLFYNYFCSLVISFHLLCIYLCLGDAENIRIMSPRLCPSVCNYFVFLSLAALGFSTCPSS